MRNEAEHIRSAVASMQGQRFDGAIEFVFIDGRSDDETVDILRELQSEDPRIRVLDNPARRTPNALNIGLTSARGTYVSRMDAHTIYPPDYLAEGVRRLERGDIAWSSGPQIPKGIGRWSSLVASALASPLGVGGAGFRTLRDQEIEVDSGFTGVWRRDTLVAHDGWDEGWPINQDGELAARVRGAGGRIVCVPSMAASYVPRNSLRALARQYARYGRYRVKTVQRHPTSMRRSHVLAPGLTLLALAGALSVGRAGVLPRLIRAGLGIYVAAVVTESVRIARRESSRDAPRLSLVFATMHLAWGLGFLSGCVSFGVPVRALRELAGSRVEAG